MGSENQVYDAVASIESPLFLDRSLGELGLVSSVQQKKRGKVAVELVFPAPISPEPLNESLQVALAPYASGADINIELMSEDDAEKWMQAIKTKAGPAIGEPGNSMRTIAVSSGKGGVGKSSVSGNLAVALRRSGQRVGIVDGDIWGFSIPAMLGIDEPPVMIGDSIIPPVTHGVKVMSMDYFVGDDKAVIWRGPMLHRAIEQFLKDVFWDTLDFLIVDMPPGTGDIAISMSQFLPRAQVLVVTTPQPTAQRVAKRAALMAAEVDQEVIGVVENMSWFTGDDGTRYSIFGDGGGAALADELEVPLLGQIPLVPALREGADRGLPVTIADPGGEAADAFDALAVEIEARRPRLRVHPELVIS